MDCCDRKRLLMVMTSACACAAFGLLCIAVATDYWLYTKEKLEEGVNGTMYNRYWSGLFRKCKVEARDSSKRNCTYIKYFTVNDDRDGIPQTDAILLTMRRSTWFPLSSLVILLIAGTICFVGHCESGKKNLTFVSGILFVLAGLCTLVGIILYIGSITEEVGNKPKVSLEDLQFTYTYGSSFMMAVGSFALTEMSGVFSVYLYITRYKNAQKKKRQEALKSETNDRNQHWRHKRSRPQSRDRSQSRERSRDTSLSRSESYYTYTPISETTCASHELSNYSFPNDSSRNTLSTTTIAETHVPRENLYGASNIDYLRKTTPV
ncbi:voltage-dependent calcium channel gamma-7 subunit-like [Mercenaria mercenaria]|uniref:voltage-dependent calcium channel gamma-7 subunit-like n=1 Tax=Mercenaria mercenaria TaxID=6596 RepID=UPI00234E83C8|nr:voltage-dependent calcium channel gamma-7 subunit-like [Mercenaria mercenaria]